MKFTIAEVLRVNGHTLDEVPQNIRINMKDLLERVNKTRYKPPMTCSSGYRGPAYNKRIGGATNSAHCLGKAIDIADPKGLLKQYIMARPEILERLGLRMEHPLDTGGMNGGWCHLDTFPVKNNRIFRR